MAVQRLSHPVLTSAALSPKFGSAQGAMTLDALKPEELALIQQLRAAQQAALPQDVFQSGQTPAVSPRGPVTAGSVYGIQNHGVQSYLPISERRNLTETESGAVQRGLSRWWPELFSNYSTPMENMLASPTKSAILAGVFGTLAFGLISVMSGLVRSPLGLLLPIGAGILGAVTGFFGRKKENGDILDLMKRLPEGATKRDMLSDPVYQADLDRRAMAAGSAGLNDSLMTAMLFSNLMGSSSYRPRSYGASYRPRPIGYRPSSIRR